MEADFYSKVTNSLSFDFLLFWTRFFSEIGAYAFRTFLHGGGGPQVGGVTRLGVVTRLSI